MSQNYGMTTSGTYTPDGLIAGSHGPIEIPVTILTTSVSLSRGQILGVINGKYTKLNTSASDGSQTPKAILGADVAASDEDTASFAYVHGEFAKDNLIGLTDAVAAQLQAIGIYAKEVK